MPISVRKQAGLLFSARIRGAERSIILLLGGSWDPQIEKFFRLGTTSVHKNQGCMEFELGVQTEWILVLCLIWLPNAIMCCILISLLKSEFSSCISLQVVDCSVLHNILVAILHRWQICEVGGCRD